jgi:hypothetical protein
MSTPGPLAGRTIVVTRPREQAASLAKAIAAADGAPLLFPLLEILPAADPQALETEAARLPGAALAIFISPNAVDHALPAILAHGPWPAGTVPAAVGQGTVKALAACGVADFRSQNEAALDGLLSENIAVLMAAGVVKLKSVAQDGMRVRASAGAASFRREEKLKGYPEVARAHVGALKREEEDDPGVADRRGKAARERAAREREARIAAALLRLPELAEIKKRQGKAAEDARASTTDAEATVMKMGDGGFRPAYNIEFGSDTQSRIVVGVEVVTTGSDMAQMAPMVDQVARRCGTTPENWLVDGGFPAHDQIDAVADRTRVIAPVPKPKTPRKSKAEKAEKANENDGSEGGPREPGDPGSAPPAVDPHRRKPGDSEATGDWRERMGSEEARALYQERAAVAEYVNAQARNRNLILLPVRGLKKVRAVAILHALAHNLMRMITLAPNLLGTGTNSPRICPMGA